MEEPEAGGALPQELCALSHSSGRPSHLIRRLWQCYTDDLACCSFMSCLSFPFISFQQLLKQVTSLAAFGWLENISQDFKTIHFKLFPKIVGENRNKFSDFVNLQIPYTLKGSIKA